MNEVKDRLDQILELVEFIHTEVPDGNALCQFVTIRMLQEFGATSAFIAELKPGGLIIPMYQFGFMDTEIQSSSINSIDVDTPPSLALKTNSFIWLSSDENWKKDYPKLINANYPTTTMSFVCWPIHIRGAYMSVIGISFDKKIANNHDIKNYFETIGGLIGLQLSALKKLRLSVEQDSAVWDLLSTRQHKIVSMMSDGLTNYQIANELGYSHSTIRQETIRIYELLGVAGRKGATQAFRVSFPIHGNSQVASIS